MKIRRGTSSCCSYLWPYRDKRSKSLSISHTTKRLISLVKSQSCSSSLLLASQCMTKQLPHPTINEQTIPLSSSLETLFSSVSTRECVCHDRNSGNLNHFILFSFNRISILIKKSSKFSVMSVHHHHQSHVFVVVIHELILVIRQVN